MMKSIFFSALTLSTPFAGAAPSATELIAAAEEHTQGKTFQGEMEMVVQHGDQERKMKMRVWLDRAGDRALVRILEPAKDRGTGNLRLKMDLWQYLPNVNRIIRVPSSMMLQSWMGSDFTNDDLVRASSLKKDYTHKILSKEKLGSFKSIKLELLPKPDAPVVWGKVHMWVRDPDAVPLRQEFYNEQMELVKVMNGEKVVSFGSHTIPTVVTMINEKKRGNKTVMIYNPKSIIYDKSLSNEIFTQLNLQRPL